jgi:O-antigen/teichoic acid export membrane protein
LIVSLAMLVGVSTGNVTVVLLMGGKSVWVLANTAAALAVNIILNLVLIPPFGMSGAAIAWAATGLVINVVPLAQVRRFLGLDPFGRGFLIVAGLSTACFGGIGVVVRTIAGPTITGFIAFAITGTALYAYLLYRYRAPLHLGLIKQALLAGTGRRRRPKPARVG